MKAIVVEDSAQGKTLRLREVAAPKPRATELLVRIRSAGVNRSDLSRTQKHYAKGDLHIAGNEMSGEIIEMGDAVKGFQIGDRVMALVNGGYAEQVCFDSRLAMKVPERMSWEAAAAIPVNFLTAHDALCTVGKFTPGEAVLIHAVTSGVGIAAVLLAKLLGASSIIGTTRSAIKAKPLLHLGLGSIIDRTEATNITTRVLVETGGKGVPLVLDVVGGNGVSQSLGCTALGGRVVLIGLLDGTTGTIDLDVLVFRRISLIGVSFRARTLEERQAICDRFVQDMGAALTDGTLTPLVFRSFPLAAASEAQELMRSDTHLGKIVLIP